MLGFSFRSLVQDPFTVCFVTIVTAFQRSYLITPGHWRLYFGLLYFLLHVGIHDRSILAVFESMYCSALGNFHGHSGVTLILARFPFLCFVLGLSEQLDLIPRELRTVFDFLSFSCVTRFKLFVRTINHRDYSR